MSTRAAGLPPLGALEVQNQVASVALPTVANTLLVIPTIINTMGGITYDTGTGIITSAYGGMATTSLLLNVSVPAARSIFFYTQVNTGSGFVTSRYSARRINFTAATDGQISLPATGFFPAGVQVKFFLWADGAGNLMSTDVPGTTAGTVTVPAIRLQITGI